MMLWKLMRRSQSSRCLLLQTNIIPPEESDGLWTCGEPWHVTIDINSLETMVYDLESEVSAAVGGVGGVTPEILSKI